jgi:hypothetical protein
LQGSDAIARAGHFEVHVAVMVFGARDVGKDGVFSLVADDQTHGDARARGLDGHASVHQGERTAADRGHRRRTVGFHNVGNQAHGVGKVRLGRKQV